MSPGLWRRLDLPGHDAAWLRDAPGGGTELTGLAVFHEGEPTALSYQVQCDPAREPSAARVRGWHGARPVEILLRRDALRRWTLDGAPCPAVDGCVDLDLSFTPATNALALRRLALGIGATARLTSAWLDWPEVRLIPLAQRYTRLGPGLYDYEGEVPGAPSYCAELRVDDNGWIQDYPGLWQAWTPEPGS